MRWLRVIELREPWLLLLVLLALPVWWWARRGGGRLTFSSVTLLPAHTRGWRARLSWVPDALLALAAVAFAIGVAGPRVADRTSRVQREGIAIMMAVDVSGSMQALDLSTDDHEVTRLEAVKEVFLDFLNPGGELPGRPNDAIGIVSFAGYADTRAPLTLDTEAVSQVATSLEIVRRQEEDGTAIGDGLGLAVERLREAKARSKVVVLLTDGVQNAGELAPLAAAELARATGVKVYTIGAGTNGLAPIRVEDPFTGRSILRRMQVEVDEDGLKAIAEATGGRFFRATDSAGLKQVYRDIDLLERTRITEERFREYRELYALAAGAGLLLASLGWITRASVWRRLP